MCEKIFDMIDDVKKGMNDITIDMVGSYYEESMYIADAITEHADGMVDIYTSDLMEWAGDNIYAIEEAVDELGYPGDFLRMIQQGQVWAYEQEMYEDQRCICEFAALLMLRDEIRNGLELTDDQIELIIDDISDDYERFDQIADDLKEAIESVTGSDDE